MSVNKVILVGNLGKDPEVRYLPSGEAVASATLATTDKWKDKSGQMQERTEWHNLSFFGRQAEVVGQYLKKGSQIYVEGSIRTEKWQDKNTGQDRYTTKIVVNSMQMLGSRQGGGNGGGSSSGYQGGGDEQFDQRPSAPAQRPAAAPSRPAAPPPAKNNFDDFDDDIPF